MKSKCSKYIKIVTSYKLLAWLAFSSLFFAFMFNLYLFKTEQKIPKHLQKYLRFPANYTITEEQLTPSEAESLRSVINNLTYEACEILNWKKYGSVKKDTTIIIVQVHRNAERLQYLIASLAQVQDIEAAMLIFSHSYYHPAINDLIRSIDFCKVMQLYYPYSIQANPDRFPGSDTNDCPSNKEERQRQIDSGFVCVDRDAKRTEYKHHWWWKARYVFETLEWSGFHQGMVLFLEENMFVAPDLLHMIRYAQRAFTYFPSVTVLSFGKRYTHGLSYDLLLLDAWRPLYAVGMAFNKTSWQRIVRHRIQYCVYDDCSWRYSLLNVFRKFPDNHADMIACMAPRVMSTGDFRSGRDAFLAVQHRLAKAELFPSKVRSVFLFDGGVGVRVKHVEKGPGKGTGGWGDIRDQLFCIDPLMTTDSNIREQDETITPNLVFNDTILIHRIE